MKRTALIFSLFYSQLIWSFPCYFTVAKDSCWTQYQVSVEVVDAAASKTLLTLDIPPGKSWVREKVECVPAQNLIYLARFSPSFWQNDENKVYKGHRNWFLPGSVKPGDKAWTISLCYPADFAEVPLPPKADSRCHCDFSSIPEVTS